MPLGSPHAAQHGADKQLHDFAELPSISVQPCSNKGTPWLSRKKCKIGSGRKEEGTWNFRMLLQRTLSLAAEEHTEQHPNRCQTGSRILRIYPTTKPPSHSMHFWSLVPRQQPRRHLTGARGMILNEMRWTSGAWGWTRSSYPKEAPISWLHCLWIARWALSLHKFVLCCQFCHSLVESGC